MCGCGHYWRNDKKGLMLKLSDLRSYKMIDTSKSLNPDFIEQLMGYPESWTDLDEDVNV